VADVEGSGARRGEGCEALGYGSVPAGRGVGQGPAPCLGPGSLTATGMPGEPTRASDGKFAGRTFSVPLTRFGEPFPGVEAFSSTAFRTPRPRAARWCEPRWTDDWHRVSENVHLTATLAPSHRLARDIEEMS
jgi:hypothetical protein